MKLELLIRESQDLHTVVHRSSGKAKVKPHSKDSFRKHHISIILKFLVVFALRQHIHVNLPSLIPDLSNASFLDIQMNSRVTKCLI